MNNCQWPTNTNDCLFFAKKQSVLSRTSTRPPMCKTTMERLFDRSKFGDYVSWELYHLETTLKLSQNLSKKRIFPCSFLNYAVFDELCEKLRLEVNYAKSQQIYRNKYQKPWLDHIIHDELHLTLRVTDVLTRNLLGGMIRKPTKIKFQIPKL